MRTSALFAMALCALAMTAGAAGAARADGPRMALLIGNESYPGQPPALSFPARDVEVLRGVLVDAGFEVEVVRDADQATMTNAIEAFAIRLAEAAASGPEPVGLFYYAGHGAVGRAEGARRNFMLPAGAEIASEAALSLRGVRLDRAIDALQTTGAEAVFIVYDACRNEFSRGSRGFEPLAPRTGLLIAMSTADGSTTPDDGRYAAALALEIARPDQDALVAFARASAAVGAQRLSDEIPVVLPALRAPFCFHGCEDDEPAPGVVEDDAPPASPPVVDDAPAAPPPPLVPSAEALTREAQTLLAEMGYRVGEPDGVAGPRTLEAATAFRAAVGLSQSGWNGAFDADFVAVMRLFAAQGHRAASAGRESAGGTGGPVTDAAAAAAAEEEAAAAAAATAVATAASRSTVIRTYAARLNDYCTGSRFLTPVRSAFGEGLEFVGDTGVTHAYRQSERGRQSYASPPPADVSEPSRGSAYIPYDRVTFETYLDFVRARCVGGRACIRVTGAAGGARQDDRASSSTSDRAYLFCREPARVIDMLETIQRAPR